MKRTVVVVLLGLATACGPRAEAPRTSTSRAPGAPKIVPGSLEARPLLGELPVAAARLGAGPVAIVASGTMVEGERLGAFVEIPKDACLLTYARSSPSLEDIDLATFAEEGNPLAIDEGPDPRPTVMLCPPHPERVYVAAHAASGEGLCVIAAQIVPKEHATTVGKVIGARGSVGGPPRTPEAWPGLEDKVRAHRAATGGQWEELRRVAVSTDARVVSSVAFAVDEGGCTDAYVIPDDDVAMVDVDVLDGEGRLVARAKDGSVTRSVTVCSPIAMAGSLQIRPHVGRGLVAAVLAKAKPDTVKDLATKPDVAWVAPVQSLDATRALRNGALGKAGYGAAASSQNGQLQVGRRATVPVDLATDGSCTRIDVVAGAPLALVDASVWDDGGALLGSGEGGDGATVFACGKGKARVDIGTRGRPGPYAVLARPERWKSPELAAHPLAGGRMLTRAASGPVALLEGVPGPIRHAVLDATHQYVHNTTIITGQCARFSVGVQGEGTGIEARLLDAVTGDELDRSHGQTSAAVRVCASSAPRSVRVEIHATAGKLDAILGERLSK